MVFKLLHFTRCAGCKLTVLVHRHISRLWVQKFNYFSCNNLFCVLALSFRWNTVSPTDYVSRLIHSAINCLWRQILICYILSKSSNCCWLQNGEISASENNGCVAFVVVFSFVRLNFQSHFSVFVFVYFIVCSVRCYTFCLFLFRHTSFTLWFIFDRNDDELSCCCGYVLLSETKINLMEFFSFTLSPFSIGIHFQHQSQSI